MLFVSDFDSGRNRVCVTAGKGTRNMARFCENCGARVPEDSVFCENCGARLAPPARMTHTPAVSGRSRTTVQIGTMTEAVGLAVSRNPSGAWSYWDSPDSPDWDARRLLRFAQKEDRRLRGTDMLYPVSRAGSVGHIYEDEEEGRVLEWVFYAPGEDAESLPASPEEL